MGKTQCLNVRRAVRTVTNDHSNVHFAKCTAYLRQKHIGYSKTVSRKEQSPPSCKNRKDSSSACLYGATTHTRDQRDDAETCLLSVKKKVTQRLSFQSQTQALRNPVSCSPGASGFRKLEGRNYKSFSVMPMLTTPF